MGIFDSILSGISSALSVNPMTAIPFTAAKAGYNYATQPSAQAVADSAMLTQQAYDWDAGYATGRTVAPLAAPAATTPGASYYTVKSGDTLSRIAAKYGTTYQQIMSWNNLKSTVIYPGDRLLIRSAAAESSFLTEQADALDQAYASGRTVLTATPKSGTYGPVGPAAPAGNVPAASGLDALEKYLPWAVGGLLVYKLFIAPKKGGGVRRAAPRRRK
jgi:LysM repeat protein